MPSGRKVAKDRVTILITANMAGEKMPLLMIGKTMKPRGFPKDMLKLPLQYEATKKAWMNRDIFSRFLKSWDRKLRIEGA